MHYNKLLHCFLIAQIEIIMLILKFRIQINKFNFVPKVILTSTILLFCLCSLGSRYLRIPLKKITKQSPFKILNLNTPNKDTIKFKDDEEIKYQAKQVVNFFEILLNTLSSDATSQNELNSLISKSYSPAERFRIFFNNKVIIEDDTNPRYNLGNTRDLEVDKYLKVFDIYYRKSPDFNIKFSNIQVSNVKKSTYTYVRVKFDSYFNGRYMPNNSAYEVKQREATLRVDRQLNGKFNIFIVGISFFNPKIPIENSEHDIVVMPNDTGNYYFNIIKKRILSDSSKDPISLNQIVNLPVDSLLTYPNFPDFSITLPTLDISVINQKNPEFYLRMKFEYYTENEKDKNPHLLKESKVLLQRNGRNCWNGFIANVKPLKKDFKTSSGFISNFLSSVNSNKTNNQERNRMLNYFSDYNINYGKTSKPIPDFQLKLNSANENITNSKFYLKIKFDGTLDGKYLSIQKTKEPIKAEILVLLEYNKMKTWNGFIKSYTTAENKEKKNLLINDSSPVDLKNKTLIINEIFKALTIPLKIPTISKNAI